jgi:uncharacterized protein (DUF488 family)
MMTRAAEGRRESSARRVPHPIFTIGHSTRPIDEFVACLHPSQVECVVDVRTVPRSRTNPQYNRDTLPATLAAFAIDYLHVADLGGLRPRSRDVPPSRNGLWRNASFHNYADYALTPAFGAALAQLRLLAHRERAAIMCSEAVWWRCHRRIVSDYLIVAGEAVVHIMAPDKVEVATLTPGAVPQPGGEVFYPDAEGAAHGGRDLFDRA